MPETVIACLACGHKSPIAVGEDETAATVMARSVLRCDRCDARMAYGEIAPRIVVEPTARNGMPMMRVRVQDAKTRADVVVHDLDPQHAFLVAQSIISLVRP